MTTTYTGAKRRSAYIGEGLARALGTRLEGEDASFSGALNAIAGRYADIIERSMPTFTESQWCAICDANNGTWLIDPFSPTMIWANVADSDGIGEKWEIDALETVTALRELTYCQACAVADVIERFWKSPRLNTASNRELLAEAGAKIKESTS